MYSRRIVLISASHNNTREPLFIFHQLPQLRHSKFSQFLPFGVYRMARRKGISILLLSYFAVHVVGVAMAQNAVRLKDTRAFMQAEDKSIKDMSACETLVPQEIKQEIKNHQGTADLIIDHIVRGKYKGMAYDELHDFVDKHPRRFSGFQNLEDSIDYMMGVMKNKYHLEHVRGEQVTVPHWVRGNENAELLQPRKKSIPILGLGSTVGTPEQGITAKVIVVTSFEDLAIKKDQIQGKIVVFNQGWKGYGKGYAYRNYGASAAAQYGAVAALIRSVTPFSLNTLHTGSQGYWTNVTRHIPVACITVEDADLMLRLQTKGETIIIKMQMSHYSLPLTTSRNAIGEIRGSEIPDEYVLVSGHIDNWDVGQGAMDDGGGVVASVLALGILKDLGLQPKRTLQTVLWTAEEPGLYGVEGFAKQHHSILDNYSAVFESDDGTFDPLGLDFAGSQMAACIVNEILQLTARLNTTRFRHQASVSSDISKLIDEGVPGVSLSNANNMYFFYHHSEADTMTLIDPDELDRCTALWTVTSFVVANLTSKLPRDPVPKPQELPTNQ